MLTRIIFLCVCVALRGIVLYRIHYIVVCGIEGYCVDMHYKILCGIEGYCVEPHYTILCGTEEYCVVPHYMVFCGIRDKVLYRAVLYYVALGV